MRHKWTVTEKFIAGGLMGLCFVSVAGCFLVPATAVPCAVMAASIVTGVIGWLTTPPGVRKQRIDKPAQPTPP